MPLQSGQISSVLLYTVLQLSLNFYAKNKYFVRRLSFRRKSAFEIFVNERTVLRQRKIRDILVLRSPNNYASKLECSLLTLTSATVVPKYENACFKCEQQSKRKPVQKDIRIVHRIFQISVASNDMQKMINWLFLFLYLVVFPDLF